MSDTGVSPAGPEEKAESRELRIRHRIAERESREIRQLRRFEREAREIHKLRQLYPPEPQEIQKARRVFEQTQSLLPKPYMPVIQTSDADFRVELLRAVREAGGQTAGAVVAPMELDTEAKRRTAIEEFLRLAASIDVRIDEIHFYRAAGYTHPTEFYRWRRCAKPVNKTADRKFRALLMMTPENFVALVKEQRLFS